MLKNASSNLSKLENLSLLKLESLNLEFEAQSDFGNMLVFKTHIWLQLCSLTEMLTVRQPRLTRTFSSP